MPPCYISLAAPHSTQGFCFFGYFGACYQKNQGGQILRARKQGKTRMEEESEGRKTRQGEEEDGQGKLGGKDDGKARQRTKE